MKKRKAKSDAPFAVPNWPAAKVEMRALSKIKDYPSNPRTHPESQIDALATLMKKYGPDQPIVVDENGVILKGHGRKASAIKAGFEEFPVVVHVGLSENDKRAVRISDNQIALLSSWNPELLRLEVSELKLAGFDMPLLGFDTFQLAEIMTPTNEGLPEQPKNPVIRRGDLWVCGEHRILCGDSTNAEDVKRVLDGDQAQMIFTDPPYGVDYTGGAKKRVRLDGDDIGTGIYAAALPHLRFAADDKAALYLWYADGHAAAAAAAAAAAGYKIVAQVIWAKNHAQFVTSAHYKGKHEPCFYAHRNGKAARWYGPNNEVTLWEANRSPRNDWHPTQKPVELAERAIKNSSASGDIVLDMFVGGGTTIIGCESTGRKAITLEIDPSYCQVAIERWQLFAGKKAELDGRTLEQVAKARRKPTPQAQPATRASKRERAAQVATPS